MENIKASAEEIEQMIENGKVNSTDTIEIIGDVAATLNELKTMAMSTDQKIILNEATKMRNYSGNVTDLVTAFGNGFEGYTGNITIVDNSISNEDYQLISRATSGIVRDRTENNIKG